MVVDWDQYNMYTWHGLGNGHHSMRIKEMKTQESERFRVGALLAITGGILDAYTYLCRGGVFANAQTGNIVLIGIRSIDKDWSGVLSAVVPVGAFIVGVFVTELMRSSFKTSEEHMLHWRHMMLAIEIALLAVISFVPLGKMNHFVNVVISLVCAMQVQTFRKFHGYAFATTMCTGNLRTGTEALSAYMRTGNPEQRHRCACSYGIIMFFVIGALLGAFTVMHIPRLTIPLALVCYVIVFLMMIKWDAGKRK